MWVINPFNIYSSFLFFRRLLYIFLVLMSRTHVLAIKNTYDVGLFGFAFL
jgi:hypothetical protein